MIVTIEGEIRKVTQKVNQKDGSKYFDYILEQRTDGPTENVFLRSTKDGRKVGDKVKVLARVWASGKDQRIYLNTREI